MSPAPRSASALAPAARRPSRFFVVIFFFLFLFEVVPSRLAPLQRVRVICSRLAAPGRVYVGSHSEQGRQRPCDIEVVSSDPTGERKVGNIALRVLNSVEHQVEFVAFSNFELDGLLEKLVPRRGRRLRERVLSPFQTDHSEPSVVLIGDLDRFTAGAFQLPDRAAESVPIAGVIDLQPFNASRRDLVHEGTFDSLPETNFD